MNEHRSPKAICAPFESQFRGHMRFKTEQRAFAARCIQKSLSEKVLQIGA